jgi:hypothetical protein
MRSPEVRTIVPIMEINIESQNSERTKGNARNTTTKTAMENLVTDMGIP